MGQKLVVGGLVVAFSGIAIQMMGILDYPTDIATVEREGYTAALVYRKGSMSC
jgi:hypothetical protein